MDFVIIQNSTGGSLEPRIHVDVMWHKTSPEPQIRIKTAMLTVVFLHHTVPQSGL